MPRARRVLLGRVSRRVGEARLQSAVFISEVVIASLAVHVLGRPHQLVARAVDRLAAQHTLRPHVPQCFQSQSSVIGKDHPPAAGRLFLSPKTMIATWSKRPTASSESPPEELGGAISSRPQSLSQSCRLTKLTHEPTFLTQDLVTFHRSRFKHRASRPFHPPPGRASACSARSNRRRELVEADPCVSYTASSA